MGYWYRYLRVFSFSALTISLVLATPPKALAEPVEDIVRRLLERPAPAEGSPQHEQTPNLRDAVHLAFEGLSAVERGLEIPCYQNDEKQDRRIRRAELTTPDRRIRISEISFEHANTLFRTLSQDPQLPFAFPEDGCYARSRYMAQFLNRQDLNVGQIYVEGRLQVESRFAPRGIVNWRYHVAPVIMVRRNGRTHPYVLDPSLFSEPVPIERWMYHQTIAPESRIDAWYYSSQYQFTPRMDGGSDPRRYLSEDDQLMREVLETYLPISNQRRSQMGLETETTR